MNRVMYHVVTNITEDCTCYDCVLIFNGHCVSNQWEDKAEINGVAEDHREHQSESVLRESVMDSVH